MKSGMKSQTRGRFVLGIREEVESEVDPMCLEYFLFVSTTQDIGEFICQKDVAKLSIMFIT